MKPGNIVEIFDLTKPCRAEWQKFGIILRKSLKQDIHGHEIIFWDVLLNGSKHRLPHYRLKRII